MKRRSRFSNSFRVVMAGTILWAGSVPARGDPPEQAPGELPADSIERVPLWPRADAQTPGSNILTALRRGLRYRRWHLQVEPVPNPEDGVFWNIVATSLEGRYGADHPGEEMDYEAYAREIPVLRVPEHLWDEWVDGKMSQAVGIHYHDLQSFDAARVLYTRFAHPAKPNEQGPRRGKQGTRVEGTLLLPVSWWLDQTIVVRVDGKSKVLEGRIQHERGHAANAVKDLARTIAGPNNWDESKGRGQKCRLVWRWRTEKIARPWEGFFSGKKPILTLRTYIDVVPPTRWSMLTDRSVEAVTDRQIKAFNDSLILISERYEKTRAASAEAFHKDHGQYELDRPPRFEHVGAGMPKHTR